MNSQGQSRHLPKHYSSQCSSLILCLNLSVTSCLVLCSPISAQPTEPALAKDLGVTQETPNAVPKTSEMNAQKNDSILAKVQSFYASAADFKSDFKQTYTYKIYGRKKISTGTVFFKKPAKMRWDYETPSQRVFVADGETLWVYEPEEAQVFKRSLSSAQLPIALRFMRGDAQLDREFTIKNMIHDESEGVMTLSLAPKQPSADFDLLELRVDQNSGQVRSSTLIDPTGNTNRIDFVSVNVNQDLPNSGFSFTPPDGVRVIDEENSP